MLERNPQVIAMGSFVKELKGNLLALKQELQFSPVTDQRTETVLLPSAARSEEEEDFSPEIARASGFRTRRHTSHSHCDHNS
jgi:hypothetical protein